MMAMLFIADSSAALDFFEQPVEINARAVRTINTTLLFIITFLFPAKIRILADYNPSGHPLNFYVNLLKKLGVYKIILIFALKTTTR